MTATLTKHETTPGVECPAWCNEHGSGIAEEDRVDGEFADWHQLSIPIRDTDLCVKIEQDFYSSSADLATLRVGEPVARVEIYELDASNCRALAATLLKAADLLDSISAGVK